ncbi:MAG: XRE family transcriptional regulator [Chitinophagia bacterium]|nr:XRE family transcriptional regulator [Chitinophagia bacterium]
MNRLQEMLKTTGIKQSTVASVLGVAKSTVSMYCSNTVQPPIGKLIKIAELLNCEVTDLLVLDNRNTKWKHNTENK